MGDFGFMAAGFDIRWQVEIDEYCQKILALRYPESEKYRDIKTLRGSDLEKVDIITGGFPCQPFSVAGRQKGKDDNRYLWPEMLRVIDEVRPRWVVGENVPGIINLALDTVCADLESKGYEVWPIVFPAHALGAWHKRDRLWIVAHSIGGTEGPPYESGTDRRRTDHQQDNGNGLGYDIGNGGETISDTPTKGFQDRRRPSMGNAGETKQEFKRCDSLQRRVQTSAVTMRDRPQGFRSEQYQERPFRLYSRETGWCKDFWSTEPTVGRVANGIADRVHRLKMLGNGQVPACTHVIGEFINEVERTINQGG